MTRSQKIKNMVAYAVLAGVIAFQHASIEQQREALEAARTEAATATANLKPFNDEITKCYQELENQNGAMVMLYEAAVGLENNYNKCLDALKAR